MKASLFSSVMLNLLLIGVLVWGVYTYVLPAHDTAQNSNAATVPDVETLTIDKTWNVNAMLHLTILTAQKTFRIISANKRYTATKDKVFLIINTQLINSGNLSSDILESDDVALKVNNNSVKPYFTPNTISVLSGGVLSESLVYLVDNASKEFDLYVSPPNQKESVFALKFK